MEKHYYFKRKPKAINSLNINSTNKIIYKLIFFLFIIIIISKSFYRKIKKNLKYIEYNLKSPKNFTNPLDYEHNKFIILRDIYCSAFCGLLSFYFHYMGCIHMHLYKGEIPIVDLTFPNIFNGFNTSQTENPWEIFFEQPFGYKLLDVQKHAKNIQYINLPNCFTFSAHTIYYQPVLLDFYHTIVNKYIPIKEEIINESKVIMNNLFKGSYNVLGILARGTDYIAKRPRFHPVAPTVEMIINDIKEMDRKYNYDYYFLTTEDVNIRMKLIQEFGSKLKFLKPKKDIEYDNQNFLYKYKSLHKNIDLNKVYLISIYILSKSIDIISARTGGALILFILSDGFRNKRVYFLGRYIN